MFSFSLPSLSLSSTKYFTGARALPALGARLATAFSSGSSSLELSTACLDFFGGDFLGCVKGQRISSKLDHPVFASRLYILTPKFKTLFLAKRPNRLLFYLIPLC